MAFDKNKDGAWMEPETIVGRNESEAWVECEAANKYVDGAWEEVWCAGIKPVSIQSYKDIGYATISGNEIVLGVPFTGGSYIKSAISFEIESSTKPIITIEEVEFKPAGALSGLTNKFYCNIRSNVSKCLGISTGSTNTVVENKTLCETKLGTAATFTNISWQPGSSRSKYYLDLYAAHVEGSYTTSLYGRMSYVYIRGMKINGKKVIGNMAAEA